MWQFFKNNTFVVGALTSLAVFLLGLLVTYLRRERIRLGFSVSSRNIVLKAHAGLSVQYEEREISRLDSHSVVLRNIGNRPLANLPVWVKSQNGVILEREISAPDGANFTDAFEADGRLKITCDLLNPHEAATIGLRVADAEDGSITVIARAQNLRVKEEVRQSWTA